MTSSTWQLEDGFLPILTAASVSPRLHTTLLLMAHQQAVVAGCSQFCA
jgi:hypothetical protein